MKLRTRITIVTATVTTVSALVIGTVAITASRASAIASIDQSLTAVAKAIHGNSNDALSQAIYSGKQSDLALTIVFYSGSKSGAVLTDSKLSIVPNPTPALVKKSSLKPQTVPGIDAYRLETIPLTNGEYLVVAASLRDANARLQSELLRLLIYMFVCLLFAGIITWLFVRRDMRKVEEIIDSATLISMGKATPDLPASTGNSEIDQLTRALNQMVSTLSHATQVEEESGNRMQEFMGDASHELRTPLTVIKGYVNRKSCAWNHSFKTFCSWQNLDKGPYPTLKRWKFHSCYFLMRATLLPYTEIESLKLRFHRALMCPDQRHIWPGSLVMRSEILRAIHPWAHPCMFHFCLSRGL